MLILSIVIIIGFAGLVRNNRNGKKRKRKNNPFLLIY
jgi:hypothetical protein